MSLILESHQNIKTEFSQKPLGQLKPNFICSQNIVAVFLGCTSTGWVGLCFLWFYVQELSKAQPAMVLVLKYLRRRDSGLKSHPTDWEIGSQKLIQIVMVT